MMGRMARFLSDEWFALVRDIVSGPVEPVTGGATVSVRHRVTGGPDGDIDYVVRAGASGYSVEPGVEGPVDIEIVESYESAAAIGQGQLTPADAFAAGRLRLEGDVALLAERQADFAALGDLLAPVRAVTTY